MVYLVDTVGRPHAGCGGGKRGCQNQYAHPGASILNSFGGGNKILGAESQSLLSGHWRTGSQKLGDIDAERDSWDKQEGCLLYSHLQLANTDTYNVRRSTPQNHVVLESEFRLKEYIRRDDIAASVMIVHWCGWSSGGPEFRSCLICAHARNVFWGP